MALRARRTHQERTLREDWPVVDDNWWHTGAEEIPVSCERVAFSRIGGPGKAAQIPEESRESKVSAGNSTRSWVSAPNVRKNAALKESSREKSHVHRAKFNGRPKLPGWLGKRWCSSESGPGMAFIGGEG